MLQYIKNEQHYTFFIEAIRQARRTIWIGTADIKDLYIKEGKNAVPLLKLLEQNILCFGAGWNVYCVRVSISSC